MKRVLTILLLIAHSVPLWAQFSDYDEVPEIFESNYEILSKRNPPPAEKYDRRCRTKNIVCLEELQVDWKRDRLPYKIENYICKGCYMHNALVGGRTIKKFIKVVHKGPYDRCYNLVDYVFSTGCSECKNSKNSIYYYE